MLYLTMRELRKKKGVSQGEVSKFVKVTREAFSLYETGKRKMNYETLSLLADYFEVSADYLLGRQNNIPSFLNDEERAIIKQYRGLSEHAKDNVKNVLVFECERTTNA